MDIKEILDSLGLNLSDPEAKRGAIEAIEAILDSRMPPPSLDGMSSGGGGGGEEAEEVEVDPDLIQPSQKHHTQAPENIDIEDEDQILDQIKHNDSDLEEPSDGNSTGSETTSKSSSDNTNSEAADADADAGTDESEDSLDATSGGSSETDSTEAESNDETTSASSTEADSSDDENAEAEDAAEQSKQKKSSAEEDSSGESDETESDETEFENSEDAETDEDDFDEADFDEDDLLDDTLKNVYDDEDLKSKHAARITKRERTLAAAKKALTTARAKKVSSSLIRELEQSIAALEALTEAVKKSIKDISDDEFNLLINRVLDAIEAIGDSGLTFTSDEERQAKVQEIKTDLASRDTQTEISAEDAEKIRAETQAIKAREREADKYRRRPKGSFKGFQDFLTSLYRAIALQVHAEEIQDDSWSAINRRYSGSGVLQPGKKIQELPNKKIPVIDFYFDQSGSWSESDIEIGQKAVSELADMEANGQIKINIYYFATNVHTDAASARAEGSTSGWNEIVKNIIATQATNVVIMTDSDMEDWWKPKDQPPLKYTVPGYVWYLWRRGDNAPRLPRDLKGRGGVQQFAF